MNMKIVIITGANSGIGKAAAIQFAREGHHVIMACRNLDKSQNVQEEIISITNNKNVDLIPCDLSSFQSIKQFCEIVKTKVDRIDVLIHNAAHFNYGEKIYQLNRDGVELTFATNIVGPYLMTTQLIDLLLSSDDARVLHACSTNMRHFFDQKRKIDFDNLRGEFKGQRKYNVYKYYGDSKMALFMLTLKMAEVYQHTNIHFNAVQIPAIKISKESRKKLKPLWRVAARVQNLVSAQPETMADTYYHICTSEELKGVTGKLINAQRDVMQVSHYGTRIREDIKQFFDQKVYPRYAVNTAIQDQIYQLCESVVE